MIGELENKFPLQASADMLPSSSSATSARRGYRTDDTTDDVSSEDEIGENRNRIRKKRSICHAMSSSLMIAKNRNRSSSIESLEAEMELSPSRRRRIRPRPNNSQSPLSTKEARLAEVDEKGPLSGYSTCSSLTEFQHSDNESHSTRSPSPAEHDKRTFRKRLHKDTPSSSPEPSRRQRRRGTVSSGSDSPTRKRTKGGSSKKSLCHNAEPTQFFTIKSNAPHLMSYETKQVISYTKCVTCGELTKSTHTELNVNLQTAQQQPIVNYVPIPVAVPLPLQHLYPQPVSVRELVQQSEEELGHGERMLMVALRRKVTPH